MFPFLADVRKWNIAQYQNIVLNEWFPAMHGGALPPYVDYDDTQTPALDVYVRYFTRLVFMYSTSFIQDDS